MCVLETFFFLGGGGEGKEVITLKLIILQFLNYFVSGHLHLDSAELSHTASIRLIKKVFSCLFCLSLIWEALLEYFKSTRP